MKLKKLFLTAFRSRRHHCTARKLLLKINFNPTHSQPRPNELVPTIRWCWGFSSSQLFNTFTSLIPYTPYTLCTQTLQYGALCAYTPKTVPTNSIYQYLPVSTSIYYHYLTLSGHHRSSTYRIREYTPHTLDMRNMYEPAEVYGAFVELILLGFVPRHYPR